MKADLTGKVVVITGAATGIGAALATELSGRGACIALLGLGDLDEAARVLPRARCWQVDVTDPVRLVAVAEQVREHYGRVDVLVVNAGIGGGGSLLGSDADSYDRMIEVNLMGSVRTVRAFLPALVQSRGYVLQIASMAALVHAPLMSSYCASKAGVEAFAHSLRAELAHRGVAVGVAYLAFTDTPMVQGVDRDVALAEFRQSIPGPLGRTYPLAPAVLRLADGICRRAPAVYAQAWLRLLPALHGLLPGLVVRTQASAAGRTEARLVRAEP